MLALLLLLCCATRTGPHIYLLRSQATLAQGGWRVDYELECARRALVSLGAPPRLVSEAEIPSLEPGLLVLSNVRCMSEEDVQAVRAFCQRGGKLLATAQSSYRQADGSPWQPNGLALSPELGGDFRRWSQPDKLDAILLGKRNAMTLKPRPGVKVLARFDSGDAAVLQTAQGIYIGEDLLSPEDLAAPATRQLLAGYLTRLGYGGPGKPYQEPAPPLPYRDMLPEGPTLRVLLEEKLPSLRVGKRELRAILTVGKAPALGLYDGQGKLLSRSTGPVPLQDKPFTVMRITRANGAYRWGAYRGKLEVEPGEHGLRVINVVSLEEYCAGVVPNEVPPGFPLEALKAMAVVARSFALAHRGEKHSGADLCDEVHCQVYGGLASEADATTAAVLGSSGVLLTRAGRPIDATFHAVCGGVGQDADRVWSGRGAPYLQGSPDTLKSDPGDLSSEKAVTAFLEHPPEDACCREAGRFRWRETYSRAELERKLGESIADWQGPLRQVEVTSRGPLGRVDELTLVGARSYPVRGDAIRWLTSGGKIGSAGLNSTLFVVRAREDGYEFLGGGWGHGVGMCQEGAAGRARAGQDYRTILEHYYPGATVTGPPPG